MRSTFAVIAGFLFTAVLSTFVDMLLHVTNVYPPAGQPIGHGLALLATAYRLPITVVGAWLTARIAPDQPIRHAMILGILGLAVATAGVVVTWNMGLGPRWYPIALAVTALPCCWLGGWICARMIVLKQQDAGTQG